jgi:hypothetical protein
MKHLLKTVFVAVMAFTVTFAYAQNDKTVVKKDSKTKDGTTKTTKTVKHTKNGKMTKKTTTKTTPAPATK